MVLRKTKNFRRFIIKFRLTAQRFFVVARPDVRRKVFEEHRAIGAVVTPIVHFAAAEFRHRSGMAETQKQTVSIFALFAAFIIHRVSKRFRPVSNNFIYCTI